MAVAEIRELFSLSWRSSSCWSIGILALSLRAKGKTTLARFINYHKYYIIRFVVNTGRTSLAAAAEHRDRESRFAKCQFIIAKP